MGKLLGRLWVAGTLALISFIGFSSQLFVVLPSYRYDLHDPALWRLLGPFNALLALLYLNYALTVRTDPGRVPLGWVRLSPSLVHPARSAQADQLPLLCAQEPDWRQFESGEVEVKKQTGGPRFCRTCQGASLALSLACSGAQADHAAVSQRTSRRERTTAASASAACSRWTTTVRPSSPLPPRPAPARPRADLSNAARRSLGQQLRRARQLRPLLPLPLLRRRRLHVPLVDDLDARVPLARLLGRPVDVPDRHARPQLHGVRARHHRRRRLLAVPPVERPRQHDDDRGLGEGQGGDAKATRQDLRGALELLSASLSLFSGARRADSLPILARAQYRYPYHLGYLGNIRSVLGHNPLVWLWPQRAVGDGLSYPLAVGTGECSTRRLLSSRSRSSCPFVDVEVLAMRSYESASTCVRWRGRSDSQIGELST